MKLVAALRARYAGAVVHVVTAPGDKVDISVAAVVDHIHQENEEGSWHRMVNAHVLVLARSNFSLVAGLFNPGRHRQCLSHVRSEQRGS